MKWKTEKPLSVYVEASTKKPQMAELLLILAYQRDGSSLVISAEFPKNQDYGLVIQRKLAEGLEIKQGQTSATSAGRAKTELTLANFTLAGPLEVLYPDKTVKPWSTLRSKDLDSIPEQGCLVGWDNFYSDGLLKAARSVSALWA